MGTKINYVDETWNPVVGCTKCSPGCDNCYAEKMAKRLACMGQEKYQAVTGYVGEWTHWLGEVYCDNKALEIPLHWRFPRRILVPSMGDLFHEKVPFEFIEKIIATIESCPQHDFLILTKRPHITAEYFNGLGKRFELSCCPNIHLGVTICTQKEMKKYEVLANMPAAKIWISFEPLLSGIATYFDTGEYRKPDWVVVGCEKIGQKPGRECKPEWIKSIVDQCKAAGVKCFVKQMEVNGKVVHDLAKMPAWAVQEL